MITEQNPSTILQFPELIADAQMRMVADAIAESNTRARLWTIAGPAGRVVFLWDKGNNVFYLTNDRFVDDDQSALAQLIRTDIRDQAFRENRGYFKSRILSGVNDELLERLFEGVRLGRLTERFYAWRNPSIDSAAFPLPAGIRSAVIDSEFLQNSSREEMDGLVGEIRWMWPSLARYREAGFGIVALDGNRIVCRCTAEYVSRSACGIGIETLEEYEKRGIATAVTARFVEHCLHKKITSHWECDSINVGSVRVAEKAGFELVAQPGFRVGRLS